MSEPTYNGWKNRSTWNVALWLQTTESYYNAMVEFMKNYKKTAPYKDFIFDCGLSTQKTGDGYKFFSEHLDFYALNEMMWELAPQGIKTP